MRTSLRCFSLAPILALLLTADDFPAAAVLDPVPCAADPSQSYALYLPAQYTADRVWPVIFGFDPGGRGRNVADHYKAAAAQYGYIVIGSNNSHNNAPIRPETLAVLMRDVGDRFAIDLNRIYVAGMSGGARVAFSVALASPKIAGVFASSAGYPDGKSRRTLPFPVFATAGTEDFNHLEMRRLDRDLTTPHHLAVFEGGHVWLPESVALEAVEWMELQAMRTGIKPRDEHEIDTLLAHRAAVNDYLALQSIVEDFTGLRDVSAYAKRAAAMVKQKDIREALKNGREEDDREERLLIEIRTAEARLASDDRPAQLAELSARWKKLSSQATNPQDSSKRRLARRVLSNLSAGMISKDAEYLAIVRQYRLPGR